VWWWYCKHLRYVGDDKRLWRLVSYGTWHHRMVKIYETKRSSISDEGILQNNHCENVESLNSNYSVLFSTSSSSFSSHPDFFRFSQPILSPFLSIFCLSIY
jgi:hypothetical protein